MLRYTLTPASFRASKGVNIIFAEDITFVTTDFDPDVDERLAERCAEAELDDGSWEDHAEWVCDFFDGSEWVAAFTVTSRMRREVDADQNYTRPTILTEIPTDDSEEP